MPPADITRFPGRPGPGREVKQWEGPPPEPGAFVTIDVVAKRLGLSPKTVRRMIGDGELVGRKFRTRVRVSIASVDAYVTSSATKAPSTRPRLPRRWKGPLPGQEAAPGAKGPRGK